LNTMGNGYTGAQPVWITDAATVTALGDTLNQLWERILAGQTGIKTVEYFPVENYTSRFAAWIPDLAETADQSGRSRIWGLVNRLLPRLNLVPADSYLITATTKAGIDNIEHLCREKPTDVQDMVASTIVQTICAKLGLTSPGININAACASSTIAVARAAALIAADRIESALVFCMDVITDFVFSGFSSLRAIAPQPCKPFDKNRSGLSLGEGAAALLLMNAHRAKENRLPNLGTVIGWGIGNDASHITAPARDGSGLIQAIRKALNTANISPGQIAAISAHGTGTIYNDVMELTAFRQVFGQRRVPAYSVKGAIGHTLGAAGGIEIALGLKALATQIVPPTVGLSDPEDGAAELVSSTSQAMTGDYLLTTNSGFGGINAAIVLEKGNLA
jgi:3-oxoacyl-[acyl-carrier-protein] synthase II